MGKRAQRAQELQDSISVRSDQPEISRCKSNAATPANNGILICLGHAARVDLPCSSNRATPASSRKLAKYAPLYMRTNARGFQNRKTATARKEITETCNNGRKTLAAGEIAAPSCGSATAVPADRKS